MSREVDIKALVSHIVLGNGMDKCRICMGDTTEGQVYLGDTVMTEGDQSVTLAELLELITGVEVLLQDGLPSGLCSSCSRSALNAANFSTLCRQASGHWENMVYLLENIPTELSAHKNLLFILFRDDKMVLVEEMSKNRTTAKDAAAKLTKRLIPKPVKTKRKQKFLKSHKCQCPTCGKKFIYAQHLFQHLKESTDLKRACHVCAEVMSRDELVKHLVTAHGRKPYDCKKCPALFRSINQYKKHLKQAHRSAACRCGECGCSFNSRHAYHAHVSIHALKTCPGCDRQFRNQTCYLYHVKECCNLDRNRQDTFRTKHKVTVEVKNENSERKVRVGMRGSADKQCFCDHCGKKFAGKKFVAAHIQIVHMKNTHRPCIYCGRSLAAAHMTEHLKIHESTRMFKCDYCGFILKTRLGYVQHLRLHTGEKPYACKHCGETFSASSRRSEHIRKRHSGEVVLKHACKQCPARFHLPYKLRKHVASVHMQDDSTLFECTKCHEKFTSCRGLLHHSRKHQPIVTKSSVDFKVYSQLSHLET